VDLQDRIDLDRGATRRRSALSEKIECLIDLWYWTPGTA
jgi:hypothetical protein